MLDGDPVFTYTATGYDIYESMLNSQIWLVNRKVNLRGSVKFNSTTVVANGVHGDAPSSYQSGGQAKESSIVCIEVRELPLTIDERWKQREKAITYKKIKDYRNKPAPFDMSFDDWSRSVSWCVISIKDYYFVVERGCRMHLSEKETRVASTLRRAFLPRLFWPYLLEDWWPKSQNLSGIGMK
jgi:hypothetical protein